MINDVTMLCLSFYYCMRNQSLLLIIIKIKYKKKAQNTGYNIAPKNNWILKEKLKSQHFNFNYLEKKKLKKIKVKK